jgi:hypothetical protein
VVWANSNCWRCLPVSGVAYVVIITGNDAARRNLLGIWPMAAPQRTRLGVCRRPSTKMDEGGVGRYRGADRAAVVLSIGNRSHPGDVISGRAGPVPCPAAGILPRRAGTWQKPRPRVISLHLNAGLVVWIRTIDSRGSIGILFEFVEPGGYAISADRGIFERL